jgi:hypothetical protein
VGEDLMLVERPVQGADSVVEDLLFIEDLSEAAGTVVQDLMGIEDLGRAASMSPEDLGSVGDLEWAEFRAMGEELECSEMSERDDVGTTSNYVYCGWFCAMACDFCFGNEATGEFHGLWRWSRFRLLQAFAGTAALCLVFSRTG